MKDQLITVCSTQGRYDRSTVPTGKSEVRRFLWILQHRKEIKHKSCPYPCRMGGSGGIAPIILIVDTRWRLEVKLRILQITLGTHWVGWVGLSSGRDFFVEDKSVGTTGNPLPSHYTD